MNISQLKTFSKAVHLSSGLIISAPQGKMSDVMCLTTSPYDNARCLARSKNCDMICNKCFSLKGLSFKKNVRNTYHSNSDILSNRELTDLELNEISYLIKFYDIRYFRFESHGDLLNELHYINYVKVAKNNPGVNFALWSKNFDIIEKVEKIGVYKHPDNMQLVQSSVYLNDFELNSSNLADKVFTVFDKDFINNHNLEINCGAKNCSACGLCYEKNNIKYINERLK